MIEVTNSLIHCLRTDPVIGALCGVRIDHDLDPGWEYSATVAGQQGAVAIQPDTIERVGAALLDTQLFFIVHTLKRSDAAAIVAQLAVLFQNQYGPTINSGTASELLIVHSAHVPGQGIGKEEDDGPWIAREQYRFVTPS